MASARALIEVPSDDRRTIYLDRDPRDDGVPAVRTKRVVVADDHAVSRRGIATYLELYEDLEIVGQVSTGDDAVRVAIEEHADVVVLDIELPDTDGFQATRRIKEMRPEIAVLIFSVRGDTESIIEAIESGASGFISKSSDLEELRNAIDSVRPDGIVLGPNVASQIVETLARGGARSSGRRAGRGGLTARERQVASLLTDGLTARAIASRLGISERTVNTHIGSLYRRLRVNNRVDAVREILQLGIPR
jgi:DNA-binding NarL/FixJ family response regulator